jgi:hypothetical protein
MSSFGLNSVITDNVYYRTTHEDEWEVFLDDFHDWENRINAPESDQESDDITVFDPTVFDSTGQDEESWIAFQEEFKAWQAYRNRWGRMEAKLKAFSRFVHANR